MTGSEGSSSDGDYPVRSLSDDEAGDDDNDDWHGPSKFPGEPESGDQAQLPDDGFIVKPSPVRPRPRDFVAVSQLRACILLSRIQRCRMLYQCEVVVEASPSRLSQWSTSPPPIRLPTEQSRRRPQGLIVSMLKTVNNHHKVRARISSTKTLVTTNPCPTLDHAVRLCRSLTSTPQQDLVC